MSGARWIMREEPPVEEGYETSTLGNRNRHNNGGKAVGAGEKPQSPEEAIGRALSFQDYLFQSEPWREFARCADPEVDTALFFPVRGASQKEAKAICARCPVQVECDDYADRSNSTYGIWGGKIRRRGKANDGSE